MSNRDLLLFLFKVFALFMIFLARVYAVSPFLSLFLVEAVNAVTVGVKQVVAFC